jgi:hypothetical protein
MVTTLHANVNVQRSAKDVRQIGGAEPAPWGPRTREGARPPAPGSAAPPDALMMRAEGSPARSWFAFRGPKHSLHRSSSAVRRARGVPATAPGSPRHRRWPPPTPRRSAPWCRHPPAVGGHGHCRGEMIGGGDRPGRSLARAHRVTAADDCRRLLMQVGKGAAARSLPFTRCPPDIDTPTRLPPVPRRRRLVICAWGFRRWRISW